VQIAGVLSRPRRHHHEATPRANRVWTVRGSWPT